MNKPIVEIVEEYNNKGWLVKMTANGVPISLPENFKRVQIFDKKVEWIMEKKFVTNEEFKNKYGDLL